MYIFTGFQTRNKPLVNRRGHCGHSDTLPEHSTRAENVIEGRGRNSELDVLGSLLSLVIRELSAVELCVSPPGTAPTLRASRPSSSESRPSGPGACRGMQLVVESSFGCFQKRCSWIPFCKRIQWKTAFPTTYFLEVSETCFPERSLPSPVAQRL